MAKTSLWHNLPEQVSSFIGRQTEVDAVTALLREARMVTLAGPGGVGKTRLSLQAAGELVDGSGDGVWFVDLAPITDPALVAASVAKACWGCGSNRAGPWRKPWWRRWEIAGCWSSWTTANRLSWPPPLAETLPAALVPGWRCWRPAAGAAGHHGRARLSGPLAVRCRQPMSTSLAVLVGL